MRRFTGPLGSASSPLAPVAAINDRRWGFPMTIAGWITMVVALGLVWSLVIWCYRQVLRSSARPSDSPPD